MDIYIQYRYNTRYTKDIYCYILDSCPWSVGVTAVA